MELWASGALHLQTGHQHEGVGISSAWPQSQDLSGRCPQHAPPQPPGSWATWFNLPASRLCSRRGQTREQLGQPGWTSEAIRLAWTQGNGFGRTSWWMHHCTTTRTKARKARAGSRTSSLLRHMCTKICDNCGSMRYTISPGGWQ